MADTPADELVKWNLQKPIAEAAFVFWNSFLALRADNANLRVLNAAEVKRFMAVIRAISWVESRHGTGAGNQPSRDPMQCGNPLDPWWKELTGQSGNGSRFIRGVSGSTNYYAPELPAAAAATSGFPTPAKLTSLTKLKDGHRDSGFTAVMSYYWGVPILIHKTNTDPGSGTTFQCEDVSRDRLVAGAYDYNGKGDGEYKNKINRAIDNLFGWPG